MPQPWQPPMQTGPNARKDGLQDVCDVLVGEEQDLALLGRQLNVAYQGHAAAQHLLARFNTPKRMRAINQIEAVHLLQIIQGATVKPAVFDPRAQAPLPQQLGVLQAHCAHRLVLAQQLRHLISALFRHFKVGRVHLDFIRRGILVPRPAFWTAQAPASRPVPPYALVFGIVAYRSKIHVIENFKISNADAAGMVAEVDLNGKSIEDTVAAWMEANKGTWSTWIK